MNFVTIEPFGMIGIVAFCLGVCAYISYTRDTLAGRTKPQRSSWLIWAVLSATAFFSQMDEGATTSLWYAGANFLVTAFVFVLSIRFGAGCYAQKKDMITLSVAAVAIALWVYTDTPLIALSIAIGINAMGTSLTVMKAYRDPGTETLSCWIVGTVASALGLISVGRFDPILIIYPTYLVCLYASVTLAIVLGRRAANNAERAAPGRKEKGHVQLNAALP